MQWIIGNPCADGVIELRVEMRLIQPLSLNAEQHFQSPLRFIFAYFISDDIFVFRSVFSSVLGEIYIPGP